MNSRNLVRGLTIAVAFLGLANLTSAASYNYIAINYPPSPRSFPVAISPYGHLVLGDAGTFTGSTDPNRFIYDTIKKRYSGLNIPIPSTTFIAAAGIDSHGVVVGSYTDGSGSHGFIYGKGKIQTVNFPGALGTQVTALNDNAVMVGSYLDGAQAEHSFVKSGRVFTSFDFPQRSDCFNEFHPLFAVGINAKEQILGTSGRVCEFGGISMLDDNGVFTKFDNLEVFVGINDQSVIVGTQYGGLPNGSLAILQNNTVTNPGGPGIFNFGEGIDSNGDIIGWYYGGVPDPVMFSWFSLNRGISRNSSARSAQ